MGSRLIGRYAAQSKIGTPRLRPPLEHVGRTPAAAPPPRSRRGPPTLCSTAALVRKWGPAGDAVVAVFIVSGVRNLSRSAAPRNPGGRKQGRRRGATICRQSILPARPDGPSRRRLRRYYACKHNVPVQNNPVEFLDRHDELRRLDHALRQPGAFGVIWGRRRVGKSRLLLEWSRRRDGLYTVADQSAAAIQRSYLAAAVAERFAGFADVDYPRLAVVPRATRGSRRACELAGPVHRRRAALPDRRRPPRWWVRCRTGSTAPRTGHAWWSADRVST